MKISYRWLKDYLPIELDPKDLSVILTDCGLEVEALEKREKHPGGLAGVFIGEVLSCERHPQADRLHLTTVGIGNSTTLNIVCGAPNVAAGQKVVVATIGSQVQFGDEKVTLKPAKIRGAQSEGMICAEDELGLGSSHEGIMVLPDNAVPGTPAAEYFQIESDWVFEIGLTPNRADAASHMGVARDLAAVLKHKAAMEEGWAPDFCVPAVEAFRQENDTLPVEVMVEDSLACPRYSGVTMTGIKVDESPEWLKERLMAIGLRPINNVVDISNYVLHETGQPLHFFDADKITGGKVIIRKPSEGQRFIALDGVERILGKDDLMICDAHKEMCLAGVFGGIDSGVTMSTTRVFIESACFDPIHIRKSSKRHGLKTDASFRFERGTDPEMTLYALKRAALLIKEVCGGSISSPVYDVYPEPLPPYRVIMSFAKLDQLIGLRIPRDQVKNILYWLGIQVQEETEDQLLLSVPRYRVDVTREADVIEEILRIYGYNAIPMPEGVRSSLAFLSHPDGEKFRNQVSDMMSAQGFNEIMCNSLSQSSYYSLTKSWNPSLCVPVLNPISQDLDVMRQTLLFGGLETIAYNRNRRQQNLHLYEFGNIYRLKASQGSSEDALSRYEESFQLGVFLSGNRDAEAWNIKEAAVDYFDLKAAVRNIFLSLGLSYEEIHTDVPDFLHIGIQLMVKGITVAWMGQVNEAILRHFDIPVTVFYAEIYWQELLKMIPYNAMEFKPIPRFPSVRRDLALVVDVSVTFASIRDVAFKTEQNLLRSVNLFDVYEGKGVEEGKKSYAVSFILMDDEATLTDKVIDGVMVRLLKSFENQLGAKLRS